MKETSSKITTGNPAISMLSSKVGDKQIAHTRHLHILSMYEKGGRGGRADGRADGTYYEYDYNSRVPTMNMIIHACISQTTSCILLPTHEAILHSTCMGCTPTKVHMDVWYNLADTLVNFCIIAMEHQG